MTELHGGCHCGKVRLVLRDSVSEVSECNCSLCRRVGGLWHYCGPEKLQESGSAVAYRQGDCSLDTWHCEVCGCVTHWTAVDPGYDRVGVNMRMFEPEAWQCLPRKFVDGASF
ncbi:MAG: GFA family protein [Erythrobacter sp.]|nr:GFA family protein [Erythrobacter sp.]